MNMIIKGFEDVISPQNIVIFTEEELGLLISGVSTINLKDWRDNTEYKNYKDTDKVNFPFTEISQQSYL